MKKIYKYLTFSFLGIIFLFLIMPQLGIAILKISQASTLIESIDSETPKAKINNYIQAIANGNKEEALKIWELSGEQINILKERKENITNELIKKKIDPHFKIIKIEWWKACCASEEKSDSFNASHARAEIEIITKDDIKSIYIFDLYVSNYDDWSFDFSPIRRWKLYEIYPAQEKPLLWFPGDKDKNL